MRFKASLNENSVKATSLKHIDGLRHMQLIMGGGLHFHDGDELWVSFDAIDLMTKFKELRKNKNKKGSDKVLVKVDHDVYQRFESYCKIYKRDFVTAFNKVLSDFLKTNGVPFTDECGTRFSTQRMREVVPSSVEEKSRNLSRFEVVAEIKEILERHPGSWHSLSGFMEGIIGNPSDGSFRRRLQKIFKEIRENETWLEYRVDGSRSEYRIPAVGEKKK